MIEKILKMILPPVIDIAIAAIKKSKNQIDDMILIPILTDFKNWLTGK